MINLTQQEQRVFQSLSESGEGEVLTQYFDRLERHFTDTLIDSGTATPADIAGCKLMRAFIKDLKNRFIHRATMGIEQEELS